MRILLAALLSVAILWLTPRATPVQLNNVTSPHTTTGQAVRTVQPRKAVERKKQVQAPQAKPRPEKSAVKTAGKQVAVGCDAYRAIFTQYGWNVNTAIAICKAESGGRSNAISSTCDRGLMQINCVHADMVGGDLSKLYDPETNISVAYRIYSGRGWDAWSAYNNGSYLRYL